MADLKMVTKRELTQSGYFPLTDMIKSDYCPKCKRIIIDSSEYENNMKPFSMD